MNLRYYRLLSKAKIDPKTHKQQMQQISDKEDPLPKTSKKRGKQKPEISLPTNKSEIATFADSSANETMSAFNKRLEFLENKISDMDSFLLFWLENSLQLYKLYKTKECRVNINTLLEENNQLKQKVEELQTKLCTEKKQNEKVYKELDFWLGQFMGLSSLEKVTTLSDFVPRLKAIIDKYGNVLKIKRG